MPPPAHELTDIASNAKHCKMATLANPALQLEPGKQTGLWLQFLPDSSLKTALPVPFQVAKNPNGAGRRF